MDDTPALTHLVTKSSVCVCIYCSMVSPMWLCHEYSTDSDQLRLAHHHLWQPTGKQWLPLHSQNLWTGCTHWAGKIKCRKSQEDVLICKQSCSIMLILCEKYNTSYTMLLYDVLKELEYYMNIIQGLKSLNKWMYCLRKIFCWIITIRLPAFL